MPQKVIKNINAIVGMYTNEARDYLGKMGMKMRVTTEDGKPNMGTCEVRPDRINVSVTDGCIDHVYGRG